MRVLLTFIIIITIKSLAKPSVLRHRRAVLIYLTTQQGKQGIHTSQHKPIQTDTHIMCNMRMIFISTRSLSSRAAAAATAAKKKRIKIKKEATFFILYSADKLQQFVCVANISTRFALERWFISFLITLLCVCTYTVYTEATGAKRESKQLMRGVK